jgi:hypothetical protein
MQRLGLVRVVVSLLALLAAGPAVAHRGHGHGRGHIEFFVGIPTGSWYAPRPYYYRQAPLVVVPPLATLPPPPPVYIEQGEELPPPSTSADIWWYYCPSRGAYYPYVKTCPQGWQQVAPQPSDLR